MVRSVTDTTTDMVPSADDPMPPRTRWWAWAIASVGVGVLVAIGVAALLPSTLVSEQENARTGEMEPTPYALTPASADPVNDRIEFGELPEGVERYDSSNDFHFVTVTSPSQSVEENLPIALPASRIARQSWSAVSRIAHGSHFSVRRCR